MWDWTKVSSDTDQVGYEFPQIAICNWAGGNMKVNPTNQLCSCLPIRLRALHCEMLPDRSPSVGYTTKWAPRHFLKTRLPQGAMRMPSTIQSIRYTGRPVAMLLIPAMFALCDVGDLCERCMTCADERK